MSLSVHERKKALEAWYGSCFKVGITVMVQIGGAAFSDVIDLVIKTNTYILNNIYK